MKKEWWKQPKKYPGILNQPYKMCGECQCQDIDRFGIQCNGPAYSGKYCFYHERIHNGRIERVN